MNNHLATGHTSTKAKLSRLIPLFLLTSLLIAQASAISVQFTDRSLAGPSVIDVYFVNGTHLGTYNTTSVIDLEESAIIHLSPDRTRDYIDEPMSLIDDMSEFTRDNLLTITIICLMFYLVVVRK